MEDYFKGYIAGVAGTIVSHPFDTIKTQLQNKIPFSQINFNLKNLYKGVIPPCFGIGLEKSIVFGTQSYISKILKYNGIDNYNNTFISGGISGLSASFVVTPFERFKILYQTNNQIKMSDINFNYLFKGFSSTLTRETPGFAIYFTTYEFLSNNSKFNSDLNLINPFIFGSCSGAVSWIFIYPQDRIKTIIQSEITKSNTTFRSCAKKIFVEEGIFAFYKGFSFALMRAIPLHGTAFGVMKLLENYKKNLYF